MTHAKKPNNTGRGREFPFPKPALQMLARHLLHPGRLLFNLLFLFGGISAGKGSQDVSIAFVSLANDSGKTNLAHWCYSLHDLLSTEIHAVKSIRVAPSGTVDYALQELGLKPGQLMDEKQALRCGVICQVDHVVWGGFEKDAGGWRLSLKVLDVKSGRVDELPIIAAARLADVLNQQAEAILSHLKFPAAAGQELDRVGMRSTQSDEALGLLSRGKVELLFGSGLGAGLTNFQSAVALEPDLTEAQVGVAHYLYVLGRHTEALDAAKVLVAAHPECARAHYEMGLAYDGVGETRLGKAEIQRAIEMEPGEPEAPFLLSVWFAEDGDFTNALATLGPAEKAAPFHASIHALLGYCHAHLRQAEQASAELGLAEKYIVGRDPRVTEWLARGYLELQEIQKATGYFRKLINLEDDLGLHDETAAWAREVLKQLEARSTPHAVQAACPRTYTQAELASELTALAGPRLAGTLSNLLVCTPEMEEWARQLVGDSSDDFAKARRLCDGLSRRISSQEPGDARTASQVFAAWSDPHAQLCCEDYTILYLALARSVGLKAYHVAINQDCFGHYVNHACAGVFVNGKAYLVDPTYHWFGVPHRDYTFADDLGPAAFYLCLYRNLAKVQAALRIAPNLPSVRIAACGRFFEVGDMKEVEQQADAILKLNQSDWRGLFYKALTEVWRQDWVSAEAHITQGLAINPKTPQGGLLLARVLIGQGKFAAAREELHRVLDGNHKEDEPQARQLVDWIAEDPAPAGKDLQQSDPQGPR